MQENNGVNGFATEELEELFGSIDFGTPPSQGTNTNPQSSTDNGNTDTANPDVNPDDKKSTTDISETKAFAKRLKESTDKARLEEREALAKQFGYASYDELLKDRERKEIESKGYSAEEISPLLNELLDKRLANDPRIKELNALKEKEVIEFGKRELAEITKLTDGEITRLEQLPKEVLDRWKEKGSLKAAYMELEGEKLITRIRSEQSKGSSNHLQEPKGNHVGDTSTRPLTDEEKKYWKFFNPKMSDDELSKKTVKVNK